MIDLGVAREFRARLKELVDTYFTDKYPMQEQRETITDDLIEFVSMQYVKSISFCVYERAADHFFQGCTLTFEYSSEGGAVRADEIPVTAVTSISNSVEKLILIELSDVFLALTKDAQRQFLDRLGPWEFLAAPTINAKNPQECFRAGGIRVTVGEIHA